MIVVTILYPKSEGSTFDVDYYTTSHMPMFAEAFGEACQGWGVVTVEDDRYHALSWATVDSKEAYDAAMSEHGAAIMKDIPNFTTARPRAIVGTYAGGS